jgi:5-methylcytosine-specific restriction endonuclease McrA
VPVVHAEEPAAAHTGNDADHIVSIAKGGAVHDLANMQPVCASCHNDKSLRDQGKRVKRRIGLDGWPCDD